MAKSKRRSKQAKRRSEKRSRKQSEEVSVPVADRLLARIQREARERREVSLRQMQLEEERAWRREQLRRARGQDWDEDE